MKTRTVTGIFQVAALLCSTVLSRSIITSVRLNGFEDLTDSKPFYLTAASSNWEGYWVGDDNYGGLKLYKDFNKASALRYNPSDRTVSDLKNPSFVMQSGNDKVKRDVIMSTRDVADVWKVLECEFVRSGSSALQVLQCTRQGKKVHLVQCHTPLLARIKAVDDCNGGPCSCSAIKLHPMYPAKFDETPHSNNCEPGPSDEEL